VALAAVEAAGPGRGGGPWPELASEAGDRGKEEGGRRSHTRVSPELCGRGTRVKP
jgi:hypothetical protein